MAHTSRTLAHCYVFNLFGKGLFAQLPLEKLSFLSGGLAAPALAAVAGTAMTTVGGASAAAAVTGIMGSSVGAAAVIAGFGAGGAHVVGGKMARRVGAPHPFPH